METLTSPDAMVYMHCGSLLGKKGFAGRVLRGSLLPRVGSQPVQTSVDIALSFQET